MSTKRKGTTSKSVSPQRSEFDSPAKPKPEETSPICSGGSQNVPLLTWTTFDASKCAEEVAQAGETVKKEKDKKSSYKKFRKGFKKAIIGKQSSDHTGKKEENISEEYEEEELSDATPAECEEAHGDLTYLPDGDKHHISTQPKKESLGAKPDLSRLADELGQRWRELQNEICQSEKDRREFNARMEICKKEKEMLEEINKELEETLANSTQELDRSRLELEKSVKAMEDLRQKKIEWESKEKELHRVSSFPAALECGQSYASISHTPPNT